jgi:hypothetical protein
MQAIVTADIVKSRQFSADERRQVNELIKSAFSECCDLFTDADADRFSFSVVQGDEFQFLINNPEYAYQFTLFFRLSLALTSLKPVFRAGIGIGDIINEENIIYEMDGPAFHNSRSALELTKENRFKERLTMIRTGSDELDDWLELITRYNDFIEANWSDKQKEAIYLHRKYGSFEKAARPAKVSSQALHQRVKDSGWKEVSFGLFRSTRLIKSMLGA